MISITCFAEIRYVDDVIHILLRGGPDAKYQILHRGIASGTALEIIDEEVVDGYIRVKIKDRDLEGWVLSQYLTERPIAKERLENIENKYTDLNAEHDLLQSELNKLKSDNTDLVKQYENSISENLVLKSKLEEIETISSDTINIYQQNEIFKSKIEETEQELESLSNKINTLENNEELDWFIAGAITISIGLIFGILLPLFRPNRKQSEWA